MPTIDGEEITMSVPLRDVRHIFKLADRIAQMEVRYDPDQLKMANDAIEEMQNAACEIAAIISNYNNY